MICITNIDEYLEILTDEEVKKFVVINFSESIKEEQSPRNVTKSLYNFLITPDNCQHHYNVEILNLFDPALQLIKINQ